MIQPQYSQPQYSMPSAVSINIYEPKSYGTAPVQQNPYATSQMQQAPYGYTNQLYAMPEASAWGAQPSMVQSPYQQYATNPVIPQYTPATAPVAPEMQAPVAPVAPQPMPESTIETQQPQATQMPEVKDAQDAPKVDTDALIKDLKSTDYATQAEAITSIANFTQASPDIALQVATDPVKQSLIDIINTDTSAIPDKTDAQKALEEKQKKNKKLTPEEQAQLNEDSPRAIADKNRIIALFTLAMVDKLARDNEAQYAQFQTEQGKQAPAQTALKDMMGYNDIVKTIQNDSNDEVKMAAIRALQYIAKPEEKAEVEQALSTALNSTNPDVKQTAQDALSKLGDVSATEPQQAA